MVLRSRPRRCGPSSLPNTARRRSEAARARWHKGLQDKPSHDCRHRFKGGCRRQVDGTAGLPPAPEMPGAPLAVTLGAITGPHCRWLREPKRDRLLIDSVGQWLCFFHTDARSLPPLISEWGAARSSLASCAKRWVPGLHRRSGPQLPFHIGGTMSTEGSSSFASMLMTSALRGQRLRNSWHTGPASLFLLKTFCRL
jgi:hypothetical protein